MAAWYTPPPWVSPIVSWGNCVVAAWLGSFCSALEEDNNAWVSATWTAQSQCDSFSIFNWNCNSSIDLSNIVLPHDLVSNLLDNDINEVDYSLYDDFVSNIWEAGYFTWDDLFEGLVTGDWEWAEVTTTYTQDEWLWVNMPDEIKNLRISSFPGFFMQWFEKQVEEIINKITDFPKLFIILPDTETAWWWLQDAYNVKNLESKFKDKQKSWNKDLEKLQSQLDAINQKINTLEKSQWVWENGATWWTTWSVDSLWNSSKWLFDDIKDLWDGNDSVVDANWNPNYISDEKEQYEKIAAQLRQERDKISTEITLRENEYTWETVSSVKAAYEIVSKLPLLQIDSETVDVNVPWISPASLEEALIRWKITLAQRKDELNDKTRKYSMWKLGCDKLEDKEEVEACNGKFDVWLDLASNSRDLVDSIQENIEILEWYKKTPEAIYDYMKKKKNG